jgi:O-6-methylguanine DNA methyltransferase
VGFNERGIAMVRPSDMDAEKFGTIYARTRGREAGPGRVPSQVAEAVRAAVSGRLRVPVPVDLAGLTPFQQKVFRVLRTIPCGETRTYAWLARRVGNARAARAVGNVMASNPIPFILPCHRVVPSGGGVGNYAFGSEMKRDLLRREAALK